MNKVYIQKSKNGQFDILTKEGSYPADHYLTVYNYSEAQEHAQDAMRMLKTNVLIDYTKV